MEDIVWNIPSEGQVLDRIEELQECLHNFPDSKMAWVWRNAIAELKSKYGYLLRDD